MLQLKSEKDLLETKLGQAQNAVDQNQQKIHQLAVVNENLLNANKSLHSELVSSRKEAEEKLIPQLENLRKMHSVSQGQLLRLESVEADNAKLKSVRVQLEDRLAVLELGKVQLESANSKVILSSIRPSIIFFVINAYRSSKDLRRNSVVLYKTILNGDLHKIKRSMFPSFCI